MTAVPSRRRFLPERPPAGRRWSDRVLARFAPLFHRALDRMDAGLASGSLEAGLPDGTRRLRGGRAEGPGAVVEMVSWRALLRLASGGSAGWYESWAQREWSSPDPVALFELFMRNRHTLGNVARASGWSRRWRRAWHALRRNSRAGARRNVQIHYDLGNDFYSLWLDPTLTYSSALFAHNGEPLETAQQRKLDAILERTGTRPGERILEIGCGWGSFAETAARAGRGVHAITLSAEQKTFVGARMATHGLADVEVSLIDYRDVTGSYDAVASIEMVEAVGEAYWPAYCATIAERLKPGGRAAIQLISIDEAIYPAYAASADFVQRHVFPGGMLLSEARFAALADRAGLEWTDRQGFGLDYAETLKQWREAFDAVVEAGKLPSRFDQRFVELWRYYLMYCEGGFRGGGIDVAQVTLVKR